jgi:hypothetical protein
LLLSDEPYQGRENKESVDQGLASIDRDSVDAMLLKNFHPSRKHPRGSKDVEDQSRLLPQCRLSPHPRSHGPATVRGFDGYPKTNFMLGMAERRAFPGGPAGTEAG